jgi:hypothetical protein
LVVFAALMLVTPPARSVGSCGGRRSIRRRRRRESRCTGRRPKGRWRRGDWWTASLIHRRKLRALERVESSRGIFESRPARARSRAARARDLSDAGAARHPGSGNFTVPVSSGSTSQVG